MRDDFTKKTKDLLGNRVGWKCSNPGCRKLTRGAGKSKTDIINIGVAAHICAASEGGPRYDATMTSEERKSCENGIWLCQTCSKLIDSDSNRYTVNILKMWKQLAEESTIVEFENVATDYINSDKEIIKFFGQCLDRPAFRDKIMQEGCMEDFDKALEDTIIAFNTGVLRTREGEILKNNEGKSVINNQNLREKMDLIVDMLLALRRRLNIAKRDGAYESYGRNDDYNKMYLFRDTDLERWFDYTREEIIKIYSTACKEVGLPEVRIHWRRYNW